jgi:stearoyl-CoA desaturase (delta-9 desaturase)
VGQSVNKIAMLYAFNVICVVLFPVFGLVDLTITGAAIAYAMLFLMNGLGVIVGYHRHISHGAFKFRYEWVRRLFLLLGAVSCSGSPLGWAAIHKAHHRGSDTALDPHSADIGFWKMQAVRYNMDGVGGMAGLRGIISDPFCGFLHKYYFVIVTSYAVILFALLGFDGVYWGFLLPAALTMFAEGFLNWAAHKSFGYSTHETKDSSKNVWWLNFLSFGEGWHNNHHKHPRRETTREKWWEVDPCGVVIRLVKA